MKLLRVGPKGQERPAILHSDNSIRDLSTVLSDFTGDNLSDSGLAKIRKTDIDALPVIDPSERIGACVGNVGKFICIGLNYADHAAEAGMELPSEPVIFMKATSAICGPNDAIEIPRHSEKTDWEIELGVVIGRRAKYVDQAEALDYVAGYCITNDVSERQFQLERTGQWTKGKSHDTFGPTGPWLVTRDEVSDPHNLGMWLEVNGKRFQDGNSNTMVFKIDEIIAFLSRFMTLEPGDIISTGTPPGIGNGQTPPVFLKAGDQIKLGIDGLGEQCAKCIDA
ncbi:Ureidoglycolate lyase [Thalassocella blandensis]|nr:Ureidoglycolate lyase [Thalassocella blandensis]